MESNIDNFLKTNFITSSFDIAYALSRALDLVNPLINNHHQRVAFIAGCISKEAGYSDKETESVILASLLHDIGVVVESEFHELASIEGGYENELCHVLVGAYLLQDLNLFKDLSMLVKYHHTPYSAKKNPLAENEKQPELSQIICLADRIDILLDRSMSTLDQRQFVADKIKPMSGYKFNPRHVDAFLRLADREHFWFDIEEQEKFRLIKYSFKFQHINMDLDSILETAKLLSRIIDFRCIFTSTHSAGVAAVAYKIARLGGMEETECKSAMIAGYLHDIGKLAISSEILYKDGKLNEEEKRVLRKHPYYTYTILNTFQIFDTIKNWAAFHHEHLDGSGYPFHISGEKLDKGCRIVAIADIFTALTENRPYRNAFTKEQLLSLLREMSENNQIDPELVKTVAENYEEINQTRIDQQANSAAEFERFKDSIFTNKICIQNRNFISVLEA